MVIFVYILLCLIWGSTWVGIKLGLSDAPPLYLSSARFIVAVITLYLIMKFKKISFDNNIKDFIKLGLPGLFMYGGSYALIYMSEQYIDSSLASILFASFPFFIAIFSALMLKDDKPTLRSIVGIVIGFTGIIIISIESFHTTESLFLGTILALFGTMLSAYGIVMHTKTFIKVNIIKAVTTQMIVGGVPLLLTAVLVEDFSTFKFTPISIGTVLYLALAGTVVTFLGYYWLLKRASILVVSLIAFITPIVAIFIGVVFMSEDFTIKTAISTILVLSGVLITAKSRH